MDADVDHDDDAFFPPMGVTDGDFCVKWEGFVTADVDGTYVFQTETAGGAKLTVDGSILFDTYADGTPATNSGSVALSAGQKTPVILEANYTNASGPASARLLWKLSTEATFVLVPADALTHGTGGDTLNNRLANTKERDYSLGLDNHGFRFYDPEVGAYIAPDLLYMYEADINLFRHVFNNPVNKSDPLGLCTGEAECRAFMGLTFGSDGRVSSTFAAQMRYHATPNLDVETEVYFRGMTGGGPGTFNNGTSYEWGVRAGVTVGRGQGDPVAGIGPAAADEPNSWGDSFNTSFTAVADLGISPRGTPQASMMFGIDFGAIDVEYSNDSYKFLRDTDEARTFGLAISASLGDGRSIGFVDEVFTGVGRRGDAYNAYTGPDGREYYAQPATERGWNRAQSRIRYTGPDGAHSFAWGNNAPGQRWAHGTRLVDMPIFQYDNIDGLSYVGTMWRETPEGADDD